MGFQHEALHLLSEFLQLLGTGSPWNRERVSPPDGHCAKGLGHQEPIPAFHHPRLFSRYDHRENGCTGDLSHGHESWFDNPLGPGGPVHNMDDARVLLERSQNGHQGFPAPSSARSPDRHKPEPGSKRSDQLPVAALADHHDGLEVPEFGDIRQSREKALMPDRGDHPSVFRKIAYERLPLQPPSLSEKKGRAAKDNSTREPDGI